MRFPVEEQAIRMPLIRGWLADILRAVAVTGIL
jgi:hypothetical protein